jgi:hypothetical protein
MAQAGSGRRVDHWPPLALFILGGFGVVMWLSGTSIQVLTSEAWMMHTKLLWGHISPFTSYVQIWDFLNSHLAADLLIPFIFAWGVQMASILTSIGLELSREPAWYFWSCIVLMVALIGINSSGDFNSAQQYGTWGQLGFTGVILFLTFVVGQFSVLAITRGIRLMRSGVAVV